jgi:hypothetical protein
MSVSFVIDPDLELGPPLRCGSMSLFALLQAAGPAPRAYICGPESTGLVDIDDGGVVAEIKAHNRGDRPVLLIEGETLLGAKQDRVLNVSVLLAAGRSTTVPVSCVEAGRWGSAQPSRLSTRHAPPRLRERKTRSVIESSRRHRGHHSDQSAVWDEVAALDSAVGALSPTSALRDVQDAVAGRVESLAPDIGPAHRQVGVIVASGGRPTVLELLDDPVTFDAYWHSLIEGYALDAALSDGEDTTTPAEAASFLDATRNAPFETRPGLSLGDHAQAETHDLTATGISWGGQLLHLACFATAANG